MSPNQFRAALAALGLSQGAAASFLGISIRTSAGYASGERAVPEGYAKLLRLMVRLGLNPDDVK
jgi:transcriptional regulator with XRE-family HTH domain